MHADFFLSFFLFIFFFFAGALRGCFIQLAFRACHALRERKLSEVRRILGAIGNTDETTVNLDKAVKQHLKDTAETFPMGDIERQVANQVGSRIPYAGLLIKCSGARHQTMCNKNDVKKTLILTQ